jgi:acetyl esterase/lipase
LVPGPDGEPDLLVLILSPALGGQDRAALYHIHGGGLVMGDRSTDLSGLLQYVVEGKAIIVSVEYRLAPEHPHPAPVEDCYAGLAWTARNAAELGIDPDRLIVVGTSAGGGLAAASALIARDRGFPDISHQVLICPMLDDRLGTHSSRMADSKADGYKFGWDSLLGPARGGPDVSPYAAPARATDLARLPRTYMDCGSAEGFRDETLIYAHRLSEAGVSVDLHMWGGGFHGFDQMVPDAAISRASVAARDEFMRRAIGT